MNQDQNVCTELSELHHETDHLHYLKYAEKTVGPISTQSGGETICSNIIKRILNDPREEMPASDFPILLNQPGQKITPSSAKQNSGNLFRLFIKNGEYVYARSNDIIMMESCDHLVKVYLALNDKIKKTVRHNTLKDFLAQLPQDQFMRIGRFCAVNLQRLSGGSFNEQAFEFDFKVSVKLKHAISNSVFNTIGK